MPRVMRADVDTNGFVAVVGRTRDDLAQAITRGLPCSVPFLDLAGKLPSKAPELLDALVDGGQVPASNVQHMRAGRAAGTAELQNFRDLLQGKAQPLGLLDEAQFFDCGLGVPPISGFRTSGRFHEADALVVPDRRRRQAGPLRDLSNKQARHAQ